MSLFHNFTDKQKVVVDADAINILAHNQNITSLKGSVITPHPKELSRLLNVDIFEINTNREKYARIASQTYQCVTVLKGHNTIITDGDKIFVNLFVDMPVPTESLPVGAGFFNFICIPHVL